MSEHGLLAPDWWNGNQSILVDVDLTGLLIGATAGDQTGGYLPGVDRGYRRLILLHTGKLSSL
jgi:hypothetical protein